MSMWARQRFSGRFASTASVERDRSRRLGRGRDRVPNTDRAATPGQDPRRLDYLGPRALLRRSGRGAPPCRDQRASHGGPSPGSPRPAPRCAGPSCVGAAPYLGSLAAAPQHNGLRLALRGHRKTPGSRPGDDGLEAREHPHPSSRDDHTLTIGLAGSGRALVLLWSVRGRCRRRSDLARPRTGQVRVPGPRRRRAAVELLGATLSDRQTPTGVPVGGYFGQSTDEQTRRWRRAARRACP